MPDTIQRVLGGNIKNKEMSEMLQQTRDVVAYIAGRYINKTNKNSIYSYSESSHITVSGDVSEQRINIFDHRANYHVTGDNRSGKFSLYNYSTSTHIDIKFNGDKFSGYDWKSCFDFDGIVRGNSITLYDYETSTNYEYSL